MKKSLLALAFIAILFNGCNTGKTTNILLDDPVYDTSLVSFEAISQNIVQSVRKRFNNNGLLECEIILKSTEPMNIAYKINWLDEQGYVLTNAIDDHYKNIRLNSNRELIINKLAQDKRAKSFKIYLTSKGTKWKKHF